MQNSGLRRINNLGFDRGLQQAQRSARANLQFILSNKKHLLKVKGGEKLIQAAENMSRWKEDLTPNQISFIESIYEKTFAGAGFESCELHIDRKRKGLRFG